MLQMSSFCPTYFGWNNNNPIELGTNEAFTNLNLLNFEFLIDFSTLQTQDFQGQGYDYDVKQSESRQGTSSTDQFNDPILAKKHTHNANERVRRNKISKLYSSLRALLPASDQRKKLSIPQTVVKIVEYIPELQKEVKNLIRVKEELESRFSALQDETPIRKKCKIIKDRTTSCSISTNKLGDKEMTIQISAFEGMSIVEVILLLEKCCYVVVDVSSFQTFGGICFYNLHVWMSTVNFVILNEALLSNPFFKSKSRSKSKSQC